jgi:hypothetical protein
MISSISTAEVMSVLGFERDDLELNRCAKMSRRQTRESVEASLGSIGVLLSVLGLAIMTTFCRGPTASRIIFGTLLWMLVATVVVLQVSEIMGGLRPRVVVAEGELRVGADFGRTNSTVTIGAFRWHFPRGSVLPTVLVAGQRYRAFYVARTHRFLSIDPVASDGASDRQASS